MFLEIRTKKGEVSLSIRDMVEPTKDGKLSTLMKARRKQPRVSTRASDSISPDHSILDQDSQCKELLKLTVLPL
jgi:hypothetical protein